MTVETAAEKMKCKGVYLNPDNTPIKLIQRSTLLNEVRQKTSQNEDVIIYQRLELHHG